MCVGTLILAAGRSARMGRPKALLEMGSTTFVQHLVRLFGELGPVWVVSGGGLDRRLSALLPGTPVLVNPRPELGLFSSVRLGMEAARGRADRLFVHPVDCPLPDAGVCRAMLAAAEGQGGGVLVPEFEGRRGHPVLVSAGLFPAILAEPGGRVFSDVLERFSPHPVAVEEPWVLLNLNTPDDLRLFRERAGERRQA